MDADRIESEVAESDGFLGGAGANGQVTHFTARSGD